MDLLRLIGVAALAACGQAGAQPTATSGLTPPAGWVALPEIAAAATEAAKATGSAIDGAEAWGDPARGCYGVWLAAHGDGAAADQVLKGLAGQPLTTTNVVSPGTGDGLVSLAFETVAGSSAGAPGGEPLADGAAPVYRGRLRARIAAGKITALACFANEREPVACESACTALLGGLP